MHRGGPWESRRVSHRLRDSAPAANRKRVGFLCRLHSANNLADAVGCLVSVSNTGPASLAGAFGHWRVGRHISRRFRVTKTKSLSARWLAVVSGDACAGYWICSGRVTGTRRSIHLPGPNRIVPVRDLAYRRSIRLLVSTPGNSSRLRSLNHRDLDLVRSNSGFSLAQKRIALETCNRGDHGKRDR